MSGLAIPDEDSAPRLPQLGALYWLVYVAVGDFEGVWARTEATLRLCRAQEFIWRNRHVAAVAAFERHRLAARLAGGDRRCPLWAAFADATIAHYRDAFGALIASGPQPLWGSRPIGAARKLIWLTPEAPSPGERWDTLLGRPFLMQLDDDGRWRVAGFWDRPSEPGWPPTAPDMTGVLAWT